MSFRSFIWNPIPLLLSLGCFLGSKLFFTPPLIYKSVVSSNWLPWLGFTKFFGERLVATWRKVFWQVLVEFQQGWYGFLAAGLQRG